MKLSKRFLGLFLALQFLFGGTSFSDNFVDFATCSAAEAADAERVSTNSDVIADTLEVDLVTAESETAQDTSVSESTDDNSKTEAIATKQSAKRTKDAEAA